MNTASLILAHRMIRMGTTSVLQYAREAVPWSTESAHDTVSRVQAIAVEERDEIARMTRHLQKRRLPLPKPGSYPSHFTTMNFVSIDYLLPKLIAEAQEQIAELKSHLAAADDDEIRGWVQKYLDMKHRHLAALQELAPSHAA